MGKKTRIPLRDEMKLDCQVGKIPNPPHHHQYRRHQSFAQQEPSFVPELIREATP